jgi:hypothetical protein
LQSAVILVSNADIGTKPKDKHAAGQMKMSGVRGSGHWCTSGTRPDESGRGRQECLRHTIPWPPGPGSAGASQTSWRSRICRRE